MYQMVWNCTAGPRSRSYGAH